MPVEYQNPEQDQRRHSSFAIYQYAGAAKADRAHIKDRNSYQPRPAESLAYVFEKRALDLAIVLITAPLLVPLFSAIAVLVAVASRGPIFFSHRRTGRRGSTFTMWKFATMRQNSAELLDAHLATHPAERAQWIANHTSSNDPRFTLIGRFLRKYRLDDMPQVWNVLRGEMTLVGPRPMVASEATRHGDDLADYALVKPGLTGLWQASESAAATPAEHVALDRDYVETWSLWTDVKILAHTFQAAIRTDRAF